jgi:hypothetical protein
MEQRREDIEFCLQRIAEERALARDEASPYAREVHAQMASLYMAQLELLKTSRI